MTDEERKSFQKTQKFRGDGVLKAKERRRGEEGRASGVAWLPQAFTVTCAGQRFFFRALAVPPGLPVAVQQVVAAG